MSGSGTRCCTHGPPGAAPRPSAFTREGGHCGADTPAGDPVDASLRAPHPALLVSWALAILAFVAVLAAADPGTLAGATGLTIAVLLAAIAAVGAAVLLLKPRTRTLPAALIGIVILDVAAPLLQIAAISPPDGRAALLILPTMIAAASLGCVFYHAQLVGAVGLASLMFAFSPDDRVMTSRVIEICLVAGTLIAGSVMVHRVSQATAGHIADLRRLALTDQLTGVLNRRGLADGFTALRAGLKRSTPIGVLSMDIDHFKWFNDTYGHAAGDDVLLRPSQTLRTVTSADTVVCRTCGDEFVALVHGPAEPAAEAFRARLTETKKPRVTVNIGIVHVNVSADDGPDALWQMRDAALMRAKRTRRQQRVTTRPDTDVLDEDDGALLTTEDIDGPDEASRAELDRRDFGAQPLFRTIAIPRPARLWVMRRRPHRHRAGPRPRAAR